MKTAAIRIPRASSSPSDSRRPRVVGHDNWADGRLRVRRAISCGKRKKLVRGWIAFLPGVPGWEDVIQQSRHFGIFVSNGPTPEALVRGRERKRTSIISGTTSPPTRHIRFQKPDRAAFTAAYARPGRMRARLGVFRFLPASSPGFCTTLPKPRSTMPVLAIGGREGQRKRYWVSK